jgi:D-alanine--poly(phosphoribitol) ligase subunit 1
MHYNFYQREFENTAHQPDKLAVAGSDIDLSWNELQKLTLQIADQIESLCIPKGHPLIIYGHKEAQYAAAMLACYHTGTTYIPMDTIYPTERIKDIQLQTGSQVLLDCSQKEHALNFAVAITPGKSIEEKSKPDFSNKVYGDTTDPLQYIMFTSGSTGRPKGVMIKRSSILSFLKWSHKTFGMQHEDVFMNQAPFTFDVSLCDLLSSFSLGASLILNSKEILNNQIAFLERIKNYQCSVWTSTPSFAFLFLRNAEFNQTQIPSLKHFLFMGEILPNKTCASLFQKFPQCKIANAYGPTEASIVCTHLFINSEILKRFPVLPIGYAKEDGQLKIHKSNVEDEYGELLIGGNHVASGYFGDAALTAIKFVEIEGIPFFKTGDLAKEENGLWFFAGRNDEQIKLHGFRIELNEISAVMEQFEKTEEACVIALKRNSEVKKIIAFAKFQGNHFDEKIKTEILQFLNSRLPYYMVPADILCVTEFPTNSSHKIDKNKLIENYGN